MANWIDCTDDFIPEDVIRFKETVWTTPRTKREKARPAGERVVTAHIREVTADDWIHFEVLQCEGEESLKKGQETKRKRHNVARNGVERLEWSDETTRQELINEHGETFIKCTM